MKLIIIIGFISLVACSSPPQPQCVHVKSPNKDIKITVKLDKKQRPVYSVSYQGKKVLVKSTLGIEFRGTGLLSPNLLITGIQRKSVDHTYPMVTGKADSARNHFYEAVIDFEEKSSRGRHFSIVFRAYNDGVAFRYVFPRQPKINKFNIVAEKSTFHFPGNYTIWAAIDGSSNNNHKVDYAYEQHYVKMSLDSINQQGVIELPLTLQRKDGITLAIAEANLKNYAGMYLRPGSSPHTLISKLAPLPDSSGILVRGETPFKTPWRVIMIGDGPGTLITSDIISNLSDPSRIDNTSWIKPGKVVFPWWPDFKTNNPKTSGKFNYENQKRYIDFAAAYNIPYLELEPPWYGPVSGIKKHPLDYDITKPIPRLKFFKLLNYAKKKGVRFFIWVHWKSLKNQIDDALATYEKWGAAGIKVDYMNRDDQKMVAFYHEMAKKTAKYHLMIYYHGAYKPAGIRRTWPNVLTREAVMGNEYNKWSKRVTLRHEVTIPFTRMLVGPMDFTPGVFNNVTKSQFKVSFTDPEVLGTRAHQLAMFVVYESPLQMVAGYPGAIANKPGSGFLKVVPTSWDETRYLKGKIGHYIVLARRKGNQWFIGAMIDNTGRTLTIPLSFLPEGRYEATIYKDGSYANKHPKRLDINEKVVTSKDQVKAILPSGGGWVAHITPVENKN